jgi:hypothetical protein
VPVPWSCIWVDAEMLPGFSLRLQVRAACASGCGTGRIAADGPEPFDASPPPLLVRVPLNPAASSPN